MIIVASVLLWDNDSEGGGMQQQIATALFVSCFINGVSAILTAVKGRSMTLVLNWGNLSTGVILIISICLNPKPEDGWKHAIAGPLFETACIYWLYQALFF